MFVQKLNQVTDRLCRDFPNYKSQLCNKPNVFWYLFHATRIWCDLLDDIITSDERNYILEEYKQLSEVKNLTSYLYEDSKEEEGKNWVIALTKSKLSYLVAGVFKRMNVKSENVKIIVLIAFGITAVGYLLYKINRPRQQQTFRREEPQYNPNPLTPPDQTITNQFLILVVSASQADFLGSLKDKRHIDLSDGEALYEITRYLWLDSENQYSQKIANVNQYSVSEGEESEYDIYLVSFELNQPDERFKQNVNQVDRYDAFRKLAGLEIKISPRLQMEAYGNFEVYNR